MPSNRIVKELIFLADNPLSRNDIFDLYSLLLSQSVDLKGDTSRSSNSSLQPFNFLRIQDSLSKFLCSDELQGGIKILNLTVEDESFSKDDNLIINEQTNLILVGKRYKLLVVLDCTTSTKTAESRILASVSFESVCKFMEGLSRPIKVTNSLTGLTESIQPVIAVSVLGFSAGVAPKIKMFIHEHMLSQSNVMEFAEMLYLSIIDFENENIRLKKEQDGQDVIFDFSEVMDPPAIDPSDSILDISCEILDNMDQYAFPRLLLFSDGISVDLSPSSSASRKILHDLINICVVQTGAGSGYTPISNLGHIPNNEELRFLAQRVNGVLIYAEDCPYIPFDNDLKYSDLYHNWITFKRFSFLEDINNLDNGKNLPIGARRRPVDEIRTRFINTTTDTSHQTAIQEWSFPWLYDSQAPYIAEILCSYRNYKIMKMPIIYIIKTRINEGYIFNKFSRTENAVKNMCKYEIVMILPLAPYVKILYTIKFTLVNHKASLPQCYIPPKGARIDVNVLAHHSFAILFINVHHLDQSKSDQVSSAVFKKLIRLHNVLKNLSEADELLQFLCQFNTSTALLLAGQLSGTAMPVATIDDESLDLPSNYWHFLNQAILLKPWLLDYISLVVMLRSTSQQTNLGARALLSSKKIPNKTDSIRTRYQVSTIYLSKLLTTWAAFTLSKTAYICWLFRESASEPTGFCVLQLLWETESVMTINFRFFSSTLQERVTFISRFKKDLETSIHVNRHNPNEHIHPLYVCQLPLHHNLISYTPYEETKADSIPENLSLHHYFKVNTNATKNVLKSYSWLWLSDVVAGVDGEESLSSIVEASFILLYNLRIAEGFDRAAEDSGTVTFYKEIIIPGSKRICPIQYIILYVPESKLFCTQLWIPPLRVKLDSGRDFVENFVETTFKMDRMVLSRFFLYEYFSKKNLSVRSIGPSQGTIVVPSYLCLGSLFQFSLLSVCLYRLFGNDKQLGEELSYLPESYVFSFEELRDFNIYSLEQDMKATEVPFISSTCDVTDDIWALDLETRINAVLLGFFQNSMANLATSRLSLPPPSGKETPDLFFLLRYEKLDIYFFVMDSSSQMLAIVPKEIKFQRHFTCIVVEISKPGLDIRDLKDFASKMTFSRPKTSSCVDGSILLECNLAKQNEQVFSIEQQLLAMLNQNSAIEKNFIGEGCRELINSSFQDSLLKSFYYGVLSGYSFGMFDSDRCIAGLKKADILIDLTDFFFFSHQLDIPLADIEAMRLEYKSILLKYLKPTFGQIELNEPEDLIFAFFSEDLNIADKRDLLRMSDFPLFVRNAVLRNGEYTSNCADSFPELPDYEAVSDLSIFPLLPADEKVSLSLELYSTCSNISEFPSAQKDSLQSLRSSISNLIDREIMKLLLLSPKDFLLKDVVCRYICNILLRLQTIRKETISELTSPEDFLLIELDFVHPDCISYVKEDFSRFDGISRSEDLFYSFEELCWVSFTFIEARVEIRFFRGDESVDKSLQASSKLVLDCARRANQRYLLKELSETHHARVLLSDEEVKSKSTEQYSDSLLYGFGCPEKFSKWFPVHWRLRPNQCLSNIMTSLQALSISNRRNMLIFSESFYMVFESSGETENLNGNGICLRVYGLDEPGLDITQDFSKMIESKIESLSQQNLAEFIARNPTAKLVKPDYEFIVPPLTSPSFSSTFLLVKELENPHLFLVLLRQSLLLFLQACGGEIRNILSSFYNTEYHARISEEQDLTQLNVLNIGNLSFLYNCTSRRNLTAFESRVGFGTACVAITPFDKKNNILFPSKAESNGGIKFNHALNLNNNQFRVIECSDKSEIESWEGYKVGLSIWFKGNVQLQFLYKRIELALQYTLIDYAVESYYRSSLRRTIKPLKRLPEISLHTSSNVCAIGAMEHTDQIVSMLPEILETGAQRQNPVIQSVSISCSLPLNTIGVGIRDILSEQDLHALFFVKEEGAEWRILETISTSYTFSFSQYVIVGAGDIFLSANNRNPFDPSENVSKTTEAENLANIEENENIASAEHMEEVFMFPDIFYPPFPIYGKRSTFLIVSLSENHILVSTYNWKKIESDKFFMKVIKLLNWVKINSQFLNRKDWYLSAEVSKFNASATEYGHRLRSPQGRTLNSSFASKFRELDFIYNVGGYNAIQLQKQIVDFLELFFRFGGLTKEVGKEKTLSLQEMSKVLQSITLVHSSSSPIFFSDCCTELLSHFQALVQSKTLTAENFLNLGRLPHEQSKKLPEALEVWFSGLITDFINQYVEYLESLGLSKAKVNLDVQSDFFGTFYAKPETYLQVSSVFMQKCVNNEIILVQIGFYSYFACVNVMKFDYGVSDSQTNIAEAESPCTHIVSFSYDFHLRYAAQAVAAIDKSHVIDILSFLRNFVSLNPRKSQFSRNRLIHGYFKWNQESSDLFKYILKNPAGGFSPIKFEGKSIAIAIKRESLSPTKRTSVTKILSNFHYTLILCQDEKDPNNQLEYFILAINQKSNFPYLEEQEFSEIAKQIDAEPLSEYLEEGYYLSDIVKFFEKLIESLLDTGRKEFGRDKLWDQLLNDPIEESPEWTAIFLDKIEIHMTEQREYSVQQILQADLPWDDIMTYLQISNPKFARCLNNQQDPTKRHLILFNPKNAGLCLYFRLSVDFEEHSIIKLFAVSLTGYSDYAELAHINQVFNTILHFLWSRKNIVTL